MTTRPTWTRSPRWSRRTSTPDPLSPGVVRLTGALLACRADDPSRRRPGPGSAEPADDLGQPLRAGREVEADVPGQSRHEVVPRARASPGHAPAPPPPGRRARRPGRRARRGTSPRAAASAPAAGARPAGPRAGFAAGRAARPARRATGRRRGTPPPPPPRRASDQESLRAIGAACKPASRRGVGHEQLGAAQPGGVERLRRRHDRDRVVVGALQIEVRRVARARAAPAVRGSRRSPPAPRAAARRRGPPRARRG